MKIAVILTAFDKMSSVVNNATDNAQKQMKKLMQKNFAEGGAMAAMGVGMLKSLQPAVEAYANLEEANTDLMASMMEANGQIDKNFKGISSLAEDLGNKLPGTTADFYTLFKTMMENGVKSQNVLNGVGKAAAYLAVDLKIPYAAAGEFAARMKEATGVADEDMLSFLDTISRAKSMGLQVDELRYAFSRSAGTLKTLKLQGLEASNSMAVLYTSLVRGGMSGETAATSFNNVIASLLDKKKYGKFEEMAKGVGLSFQFFKDGKFMGVENMVAQFDKMKNLSTVKRAELVNALTGGGMDAQALSSIINSGSEGYAKLRGEMEKKAGLNDKVNIKLKTLKQLWEATTGTIENMLAALGAGLAPVLKPIAEMIGIVAGKIKDWLSSNPALAKFISMMIATAGIALTLAGVIKIIQGIRVAMMLLNITMKANPFILIASLAILAISLIYANWGKISAWFKKLWDGVKQIFQKVISGIKAFFFNFTPVGLIFKHWEKIKSFFSGLWESVKQIFFNHIKWVMGLGGRFLQAGKNIVKSIWEGIKSMANKPIEAIAAIVKKIRNFLPFSPAKEGPLRDIHRIRLIETIAESVKPGALVNKVKNVASLAFKALSGGGAPSQLNAPMNKNNTSVTFNITLNGGASEQDANLLVSKIEKVFPQLMKKYQFQQSRVSF